MLPHSARFDQILFTKRNNPAGGWLLIQFDKCWPTEIIIEPHKCYYLLQLTALPLSLLTLAIS